VATGRLLIVAPGVNLTVDRRDAMPKGGVLTI
jgi:hypothetical protein